MRRVETDDTKLNKDKAVARFEPWTASWKNERFFKTFILFKHCDSDLLCSFIKCIKYHVTEYNKDSSTLILLSFSFCFVSCLLTVTNEEQKFVHAKEFIACLQQPCLGCFITMALSMYFLARLEFEKGKRRMEVKFVFLKVVFDELWNSYLQLIGYAMERH